MLGVLCRASFSSPVFVCVDSRRWFGHLKKRRKEEYMGKRVLEMVVAGEEARETEEEVDGGYAGGLSRGGGHWRPGNVEN